MNRYIVVIGFACFTVGCSAAAPTAAVNDLLIANVVIVSPERNAPSGKVDVLVRDGRIAEIGPDISSRVRATARKIEGDGRYLTPGLIDGHTHLGGIPGMSFKDARDFPEIAREAYRQIPRSYLYHGFTTVIDLMEQPEFIAEWNSQEIRPQAYFCGGAPVFDGYPMSWIPKPVRYAAMPYFLYDESRADEFPDGFEPKNHLPAAVVEKMRADGAICVKTHYEDGFGARNDLPVPSVALIRDLVSAAHKRDMPVLMHANSQAAHQFGVDAGVDGFAHGMWTWDDRFATGLTPEIIEILDKEIRQNIATQPTIQVLYGERDLHDPNYLSKPELREVLPASLIDWYASENGQLFRNRMAEIPYVHKLIVDGRWEDIDAEPIAHVGSALSYMAANGGALIFGSDTPSDMTFANPPGLNGRLEMDNWITAGVTPAAVFKAATIGNAVFFGLEGKLGTVEVGKNADLLLMKKNPLEGVDAYDTIEIIIANGTEIPRSALSASNDDAE